MNHRFPGRGVFASQPIRKGTIVDVSPVLILSEEEVESHTIRTCLQHYTYYWPSNSGRSSMTQAIALGLGSMFNHSTLRQNVTWVRDTESDCIVYMACKDIQPGEELCISYGNARLWFEDADVVDEDDDYVKIKKRFRDNLKHDTDGETVAELELSGLGGITLDEEINRKDF